MIQRENAGEENLRRLRNSIKSERPKIGVEHIEMKCLNRSEVDYMLSRLSQDEKDVVKFTWIEFGEPGLPGVHLGLL